jgi:hypothetical protein
VNGRLFAVLVLGLASCKACEAEPTRLGLIEQRYRGFLAVGEPGDDTAKPSGGSGASDERAIQPGTDTTQISHADEVEDDRAFPGVGAIVFDSGGRVHVHCSAVAISSRVVLTAAHCFAKGCNVSAPPSGVRLRFVIDEQADSASPYFSTAITGHRVSPDFDPAACRNDLAVGFTATHVPDVGEVLLDSAVPPLGTPITKVGYGYFSPEGSGPALTRPGTRATAPFTVTGTPPGQEMRSDSYWYRSSDPARPRICKADSGGPAYRFAAVGRILVGITSWNLATSSTRPCSRDARDTAVAPARAWIQSVLDSH